MRFGPWVDPVDTLYEAKQRVRLFETAFLCNSNWTLLDVRTGATRPGPEPGSDGRYPVGAICVTDKIFLFAQEYFQRYPWTNAPNSSNDPRVSTVHAPDDSPWIDPIPLEED